MSQTTSKEEFSSMLNDLYTWSIPLITPQELHANGMKNYVLLDSREKPEYDVSHIPGSIWVGYNNFSTQPIEKLPKDKPIVVYCSVGYRSEKIGEKLEEMGFEQVYNLYGGIFEWKHQDFDIVNEAGKETEKVHAYNKKWSKWLRKGEKVYE